MEMSSNTGRKRSNLEIAREVIATEIRELGGLLDRIGSEFDEAVELIYHCQGRVIVTGLGKSGLIGKKIAATFSSTGTPSYFLHPVEAIHGDLGVVRREDVVLAISKSGRTEELSQLFPIFKRLGLPIISIVGDRDSQIAKQSRICLDGSIHEEACPHNIAPTSSATVALVTGDALAIALLERRHFRREDFQFLHPGGIIGKRLILKVRDLMVTGDDIPFVPLDADMKKVMLEMTKKRGITGFVDKAGMLRGVLTYGDIGRLLERHRNIFDLTPEEIMNRDPKTIDPDALAIEAVEHMEKHRITSLLVVEAPHVLVGIVHLHDCMNAGVV
jgi:arabinose-5-phosphate isomerase